MNHNHNDGVLGGYFAKTQLSSWVPTSLQRQLAPGHRHIWMHQTQSQPQNQSQSQLWHAHCRDCLSQLQLRTTSPACTPQNGCLDNIGHHMHSALGAAVEISEAKCCRCAFAVEARLVLPVVSPGMVADLEMARTAAHRHHPMQGARDLNDTVTMLHRLLRNTVRGETRPIRIANAKLSAALRFDPPCTLILAALGFDLVDGEYRPPSVANSDNSAWLQRACDELSIWAGRTQRRLPDSERSPTYALTPAADSLAAALGAATYDRQQAGGGTPALAERDNPEWAFACLGVPADASDALLVWAYARLAEEDTSAEPLDGPQAQRRFDALAAIALARRYPVELQTLVNAESARGMVTPEQVRDACRAVLGDKDACLERVAAADLRSIFTVRMAEAVSMEARCILADHLMAIASAKRDAELRAFAVAARESVMELPSGPPAPLAIDTWAQLPVGLSNIGNTCYLNCMLQCLYSLAPIRSAVLRFGDKTTWNEQLLVGRRDGGRVLKLEEIRRAVRLVEMLKELFEKLQQRRVDAWEDSVSGRQVAGGHPLAMVSVAVKPARELADMLLMQQQQSEPDGRRVAGQQQQQDVDECMAQCVGLLVHALPPVDTKAEAEGEGGGGGDKADENNAETSWIHRLLAGHLETTTTRRAPTQDKPSETTCETFLTLNLNIPPKTLSQTPAADINDCLAALFAPTTIPDPQSNEEITRVSRIADAPPVLCMQVQRVQFDMETMRAFKDNTPLRLRPRLSLTPFASFGREEGGGVVSKRWELRER
ncbi:ubiquitin-specific protease ubp2, partial [Kickxella alabastrina]